MPFLKSYHYPTSGRILKAQVFYHHVHTLIKCQVACHPFPGLCNLTTFGIFNGDSVNPEDLTELYSISQGEGSVPT